MINFRLSLGVSLLVTVLLAGPVSTSYQLPAWGMFGGTRASSSGYTLSASAVPSEIGGMQSSTSYVQLAGLISEYGDFVAPTMSPVAVLSALTVYNVADVFQISFTISKTLAAQPTVKVSGRTAAFVSLTDNTYTYQLPVIYGDNGNPVIDVSGLDLDGNVLHETQTVNAVVVDTTLQAPTNFIGHYDTPNHTYVLAWANMPNENGYIVEVKLGTYPWTIFDTLPQDTTTFQDSNFLEGVQTAYRVKAIYKQGPANIDESPYTNLAQPVYVTLAAPVVVVGTFDRNNCQVNLSWSIGSPSTFEFLIKRSVNGGAYADYATVSSSVTTYVDSNVEFGKTYQYQISARNEFGGSSQPQQYQPVNAGRIPIPAGADYYYQVLGGGAGQDAADNGEINLVRHLDANVQGYMNIDAAALGINLMTASLNMIDITKNSQTNLVQIDVPSSTALAQAVNNDATHSKVVPVTFTGLPTNKTPIIYLNGLPITDAFLKVKTDYVDYIRNIIWNSSAGVLAFDVTHFSQYTIGLVDQVYFTATTVTGSAGAQQTLTVIVKDNLNQTVENAPVTFSITSGAGTFYGGGTARVTTTNASGQAYVVVVLPNSTGNITLVQGSSDGINALPCEVIVGDLPSGGADLDSDHDLIPDWWEIANGLHPYNANDAALNPDNDGLTNLQEFKRGTNPHQADTDNDGVNDKYDAYPTNPSVQVFNAGLNSTFADSSFFNGTAPNTTILSRAQDIELIYAGGSKTAADDGIQNLSDIQVQKISGMAFLRTQDGNLGATYDGYRYKGLIPGATYAVRYGFINRGNDTDIYHVTATLAQSAGRWSISSPSNFTVSPWQLGVVDVSVAPNTAEATELVTVNVALELALGTAVSYTVFPNAAPHGTYRSEGLYGGVQASGQQTFILQAEGYNIAVVARQASVSQPAGVSVSATTLVPGSKIFYVIAVKNNGSTVATDVMLNDRIPHNCHLFYTDAPAVVGATTWTWEGVTNNAATEADLNAVKFKLTIPANGQVTASYTVTVD
jgi:uncharacterized repeat protein (TIGR01451 family)